MSGEFFLGLDNFPAGGAHVADLFNLLSSIPEFVFLPGAPAFKTFRATFAHVLVGRSVLTEYVQLHQVLGLTSVTALVAFIFFSFRRAAVM